MFIRSFPEPVCKPFEREKGIVYSTLFALGWESGEVEKGWNNNVTLKFVALRYLPTRLFTVLTEGNANKTQMKRNLL